MTDYRAYREHAGIENKDLIRTVRGMYPKFDKVACSYIAHPEQRGICLLPEAEALLVQVYGAGPGLQSIPFEGETEPKPKPKRMDRRRKKNQITFRMDDASFERAVTLKEAAGAFTMQELFEILLNWAYREWEVEKNE